MNPSSPPGTESKPTKRRPRGNGAFRDWYWRLELLQLHRAAGLFDLALELLGLLALDALLDRLGRLVHECLGLLETETRGRPDDLDHLDLLVARAREDDVDGAGLLLGGGAIARRGAAGGRCGRGHCRGRHA